MLSGAGLATTAKLWPAQSGADLTSIMPIETTELGKTGTKTMQLSSLKRDCRQLFFKLTIGLHGCSTHAGLMVSSGGIGGTLLS